MLPIKTNYHNKARSKEHIFIMRMQQRHININKGGTGHLRWAQPQELQPPMKDLELVQSWIHLY